MDNLREQLFRLASAGEQHAFSRLCAENQERILKQFPTWRIVPAHLRGDSAAVSLYGDGLMAVAHWFEARGNAHLLKLLKGTPASNPLERWQAAFRMVDYYKTSGQYEKAIVMLDHLLVDMETCTGLALDQYKIMAHGALGENHCLNHQFHQAYKHTYSAFLECERIGDVEGVIAYCGNLVEICEKLGKRKEAQKWLIRETNHMIQNGQTARALETRRAYGLEETTRMLPVEGVESPAHMNITDISSMDDLGQEDDGLFCTIPDAKAVSKEASELHQLARIEGQNGNYDKAITLLKKAIAADPEWAYPYYDMAYTYLLKGDSQRALRLYKKVDQLEPKGFFTSKTAIWTLEREAKEIFPKGTYLMYVRLESVENAEEKVKLIQNFHEYVPTFAPIYKDKMRLARDLRERVALIDRGLELEPDAETKGILLLNKAWAFQQQGKLEEAKTILNRILQDPHSTQSTLVLAKKITKML